MIFILHLKYKKSLEEIEAHRPAHWDFLKKYYEKEIFLMSGRKQPMTGGYIIAKGGDQEEIENIIKEDPFYTLGLAEYEINAFEATKMQPGLEKFLK